ncbi:hypothetical protein D3C84_1124850 [compost metagenome]
MKRGIVHRIVAVNIDPVQDAVQIRRAPPNDTIQILAPMFRLYFFGVSRAYRRQLVRILQACLHAVSRSVKFQTACPEP